MLLSQVKIVFVDNYKTLVQNWMTANTILNNINCFLSQGSRHFDITVEQVLTSAFNYFKVKTSFNRAKETK